MMKHLLNSIFAYRICWGLDRSSQINYLPQPSVLANDWFAHPWQITIFRSSSSNNFDIFSRFVRLVGYQCYIEQMLISLTLFLWLRLLRLRLQNQVNPQGFLFFPRFSISSLRSRISLSSSWERSEAWVWREACRRSATLSAVRRRSDVFIVSVFLTHLMCINVCSCNTVKWIQFITS